MLLLGSLQLLQVPVHLAQPLLIVGLDLVGLLLGVALHGAWGGETGGVRAVSSGPRPRPLQDRSLHLLFDLDSDGVRLEDTPGPFRSACHGLGLVLAC